MDRLECLRTFFANLITANAGLPVSPVTQAFASIPRELFVGPGPWKIFTKSGYIETPCDDPSVLYQDLVVALAPDRQINNGQPTLHMVSLSALRLSPGETALHIGAGTGYYSAILAHLAGSEGFVHAYEIEQDLAERARANLTSLANVTVHHASGSVGSLPQCDAIYVSAGVTDPPGHWLDALRIKGRLLFPLTPAGKGEMPGSGAMLLVTRASEDAFTARFVCGAAFIPCIGARSEASAEKLTKAFAQGKLAEVRSLRRESAPDETCWVAGDGWWLSTA